MTFYSYLSASIGWRLAAFLAGYQPNKIPIPAETAKAKRMELGEIVKAKFNILEIAYEPMTPKIIPMIPPVKVKIMDSIKTEW
jgi:hypothetical protein